MNLKAKNPLLYKALFLSLTLNCFAYSVSFAMDDNDSPRDSSVSKVVLPVKKAPETPEELESKLDQQVPGTKSLIDALNLLKLRPTEPQYEALFGENPKMIYATPVLEKTQGETVEEAELRVKFKFAYWGALRDLVPTQTHLAIKLFDALAENFGVLVEPSRVKEFNIKEFTKHVISNSNRYVVDLVGSLTLDFHRLMSNFDRTMKLNDELSNMGKNSSSRLRELMFKEDGMFALPLKDKDQFLEALCVFIKEHLTTDAATTDAATTDTTDKFKIIETLLNVSSSEFNILPSAKSIQDMGIDQVTKYIVETPGFKDTYLNMGEVPPTITPVATANVSTTDTTSDAATMLVDDVD